MGVQRENGHSASVAAYLIVGNQRLHVAKLNRDHLTLAEACELAPETKAQLNVVIDAKESTRLIVLTEGVPAGQREVRYSVLAPF
jgi:hypothetical protein